MEFIKKLEPIISFVDQIDRSEAIGLMFGFVFFLFSIFAWYWICFLGGAKVWRNGIENYYRKIKLVKIAELPIFRPIVLKIVATIYILTVVIAFVLVGITYI